MGVRLEGCCSIYNVELHLGLHQCLIFLKICCMRPSHLVFYIFLQIRIYVFKLNAQCPKQAQFWEQQCCGHVLGCCQHREQTGAWSTHLRSRPLDGNVASFRHVIV